MKFDSTKYELIKEERIEELKSDAFLFRHIKSGARIAMMSNDDENKVFSIGFRTPPPDSTGVPHILEHSVLCGSDKYPVKDPFMELVKGSLNTFLNAMTYPDKTIYPVASCNDADFDNLVDVYMDAVLHPNIYKREEIFRQEGWHYELESPDDDIIYNGVVYNEMKGAYSSPDDVLSRYCLNSLYPDTSYSVESGGDPENIPDLSYEAFLGFHKKLYHPCNSYIFFYGNCDMAEKLEYLDREYLSGYDIIPVDSEILTQAPFTGPNRIVKEYSVTAEEGTEDKTYLAYNFAVCDRSDLNEFLAMEVIDYALFSASGAPVKQALLDAGIGDDISSYFESDIKQPMYCISTKNTSPDREQEFVDIIDTTIRDVISKGINKESLTAAINSGEFAYREADFGTIPKGLMYGINMLGTWLYDDERAFDALALNGYYEFLRSKVETDYFEKLVEKYFVNNNHKSVVVLNPEIDLTAKNDARTAAKLAEYKASLSEDEIKALVEKTVALKAYQTEPSTEEELKTIPMLSRDDICRESKPVFNDIATVDGVTVDHHDIYTNGIGYLRLIFDTKAVEDEDIPYLGLLCDVFGDVDTDKHSYEELSNLSNIHTGGISLVCDAFENVKDDTDVRHTLTIKARALDNKFDKVYELIKESLFESRYDGFKRIREIIAEIRSRLQAKFIGSGHTSAVAECLAQISITHWYSRKTSGIEYYNFIDDLYNNFDEKKQLIADKLNEITGKVFVRSDMIVSITGDDAVYEKVLEKTRDFVAGLKDGNDIPAAVRHFDFKKNNVGYKTASQVNYDARVGSFKKAGFEYDAALAVLGRILSSDYLWNNIRVLGGAYGATCRFARNGRGYFSSYRDPNLENTYKVFEDVVDYIGNFDVTEREMTKYIIGAFSTSETPLTPSLNSRRSLDIWMTGMTVEDLNRERVRMLETTPEDIRNLAPLIKAVLDDGYMCTIGNSEKIEEQKSLFDEVKNLL